MVNEHFVLGEHTHTQFFNRALPQVLDVSEPVWSFTQILDQRWANIFKKRVFTNDKWKSHGKYLPTDPVMAKLAVTCLFLFSDCMYGTYGMECRKACNCKAGGLCDRETGACLSFKFLAKMAMLKSHSSEGEFIVYLTAQNNLSLVIILDF